MQLRVQRAAGLFALWFLLVATAAPVLAAEWLVAPNGSDGTGGTAQAPFATLAHALSVAGPGDTITLRGGTYAGGVTVRQPDITIRSYPGETAVIASPIDDSEMDIVIRFYINAAGGRLQGLDIQGGYYYGVKTESNWGWGDPTSESASRIIIEDCRIHDTGRDCVKITPGCDDIIIRRCEIFNSGRRDDSNAEGIDNVNGDRMLVQECYIHDIATTGVYAKGGSIGSVIERCLIMRIGELGVAVGFDTSPEWFDTGVNPGYFENIDGVVRNCIIVDTAYAGIGIYAAQNAQVYNNTLVNVAQGGHAALYFGVAFHDWEPGVPCPASVGVSLRNNIVAQLNPEAAAAPMVGIRHTDEHLGMDGLSGMPVMSNNRYHAQGASARFEDRRPGSPFDGDLGGWQGHIGGDSDSSLGDPGLDANYHLAAGSPCIDAGYAYNDAGVDFYDYDGGVRSGAFDIGADEYGSGAALPVPPPGGARGIH